MGLNSHTNPHVYCEKTINRSVYTKNRRFKTYFLLYKFKPSGDISSYILKWKPQFQPVGFV